MKVLFLVGPTGSGKSDLALQCAKFNSIEIFNADSIQCYQRVDIGSAKPTLKERSVCPHHLFDIVSPGDELTAGEYRRLAFESLKKCRSEYAIVVGGSGFYIRALEKGLYEWPPTSQEVRESVQSDFESNGVEALYSELKKKDPEYAETLSTNDTYRIMRGVEVLREGAGLPSVLISNFQTTPFPYEYSILGVELPREELRERVEDRTQKMLKNGWVEEVKLLLKEGYKDWSPLKAIGYREVVEYLEGTISIEELEPKIVQSTMRLAKKQMTWFRNQHETKWLSSNEIKNLDLRKLHDLVCNNNT